MATHSPGTFGAYLKQYRRDAGLTQHALARRAGYSTVYISKLEQGSRAPLPDTVDQLANALDLAAHERVTLHSAAQAARRVGSLAATSPLALPPAETLSPLVGRERERALLRQQLAGKGPPLLLFAGEPGIGKSRILREAGAYGTADGWCTLYGSCLRSSGQESYAPLLQAVGQYIRGQSPARARASLASCDWLVRLLPELGETYGLTLPQWTLPPGRERQLIFEAIECFLSNIAGPRGTLLVLDDFQWVGTDALDLLAALLHARPRTPLRIIGAYRDTELTPRHPLAVALADFAHAGLVTVAELVPLSPDESLALATALLGEALDQRPALAAHMARRSGGVPFYLVSLAQAVRSGAHQGDDTVDAECAESVPFGVAQSIRQRAATLPPEAMTLLEAAATAGRIVSDVLLIEISTRREDMTLRALEALVHRRLLVQVGDESYRFAHDLIHETVVADLTAARRRALHRRVARALERLAEHGHKRQPAELAWHFAQGGDAARALPYALQAAGLAEVVYAHAEAGHHYRMALELARALGEQPREIDTLMRLEKVLRTMGRYVEALAVLDEAAAICRKQEDQAGLARVTAEIVYVHAFGGTAHAGSEALQQALRFLETSELSREVAELWFAVTTYSLMVNRFQDVLSMSERLAVAARAVGDQRLLCHSGIFAALAFLYSGSTAEALRIAEQALPGCEAADDMRSLCSALNVATTVHESHGHFATGRPLILRALEVAERHHDPVWIAYLSSVCVRLMFFSGSWDEARVCAERTLAISRQTGVPRLLGYALTEWGRLQLATGSLVEACAALDEGIAAATDAREWPALYVLQSLRAEYDIWEDQPAEARSRLAPLYEEVAHEAWGMNAVFPVLAWALVETGELEEAGALLARGEICARERDDRLTLVDLLWVHALLLLRQSQLRQAAGILKEACTLCRAMPYPYGEARNLYLTGLLHMQKDEPVRARVCLEAALAICDQLGERRYAERIQHVLAALTTRANRSSARGGGRDRRAGGQYRRISGRQAL